jgi:uncharacterized membrane protein
MGEAVSWRSDRQHHIQYQDLIVLSRVRRVKVQLHQKDVPNAAVTPPISGACWGLLPIELVVQHNTQEELVLALAGGGMKIPSAFIVL